MLKLFKNEKVRFFIKVILAHIFTYLVCGAIALNLLYHNYIDSLYEILGFKPMDEISFLAIILGQLIRGILLGIVIWWIKDIIIGKKRAWLKLWAILVILGIFNTYGPVSGSIEGYIYLDSTRFADMPPIMNLSILEVLVQPLLFSVIVTFQRKKKVEI
jgi:ABC-type branched-subunit amino acid transport system permease subunit